MKNKTIIYGVKTNNVFHYIGKTDKKVNTDGNINKSSVAYQYHNEKIKQVFIDNQNTDVIPIKIVDSENWYDEKLLEVVKKYSEKNPLLNAQWMLDGKRGFWEGKKRDAHTLQRLSESKYQKYCQYDADGNLVKVWNSGKEIGEQVFGDYRLINGGGTTKFYHIIEAIKLKNRFKHNYYWFSVKEMLEYFGVIPKKLNLAVLYAEEQRKRYKAPCCKNCGDVKEENFYCSNKHTCKKCIISLYSTVHKGQKRYCVQHFNADGSLRETYVNVNEAAYKLKTSFSTIMKICRGEIVNNNYILKYGEKILQEECNYPHYTCVNLIKPPREKKLRIRTRTRYSIILCDGEKEIQRFLNTEEAANKLNVGESLIRRLCYIANNGNILPIGQYLKYGEKITVNL